MSSFKKTLRKIHLYLGLASGIIVFIIAITGAIYVFSPEISDVIYKDRRNIEIPVNKNRVSLTKLVATASAQFNDKYPYQNVFIPNSPDKSISVSFVKRDSERFGYWNYIKFNKTVYLNPYSGKVIHIENSKWKFFNVVLSIHMTLFMGHNDISHYVIVWASWVFVIMLITGLILWWPKSTKQKRKFWFNWRKTSKWRRKNYDLHQILGFYTAFFALLLVLTGLMWASKSFNTSVKWVANGGKTIEWEETPKAKKKTTSTFPLDKILKTTLANIPKSKYILIRQHPKPTVPFIVRAVDDKNYNRIEMYYDKKTAELLSTKYFEDKNNGDKLQALNYDIHVGSIWGLPTKILAFLVSLIVASMPVTGFMIWWGRNKKYKKLY